MRAFPVVEVAIVAVSAVQPSVCPAQLVHVVLAQPRWSPALNQGKPVRLPVVLEHRWRLARKELGTEPKEKGRLGVCSRRAIGVEEHMPVPVDRRGHRLVRQRAAIAGIPVQKNAAARAYT